MAIGGGLLLWSSIGENISQNARLYCSVSYVGKVEWWTRLRAYEESTACEDSPLQTDGRTKHVKSCVKWDRKWELDGDEASQATVGEPLQQRDLLIRATLQQTSQLSPRPIPPQMDVK